MAQNHVLEFDNRNLVPLLFGQHNSHITYLEKKLGISIADRGNRLTLSGPEEGIVKAEKVLNSLWQKLLDNHDVGPAEIDAVLRFMDEKNLSHSKQKVFGGRHSYLTFKLAVWAREFFDKQSIAARKAVDTWCLMACRINSKVNRDIRKKIGMMIWEARDQAEYDVDQKLLTKEETTLDQ